MLSCPMCGYFVENIDSHSCSHMPIDHTNPFAAHLLGERAMSNLIPMAIWYHPQWDMRLYADPNWTVEDLIKNDFLMPDDDPSECTREEVLMTKAEIDALPEWDG